jgi:DNA ligase-1
MLAGTVRNEAGIPFPVYGSPKLDGIRALVRNGVLLSRKLKIIPNVHVQTALGCETLNGIDGELIVGQATAPDAYRTTMSGVMSEGGSPRVTYWMFDRWDLIETPYIHRRRLLPPRTVLPGIVIRKLKHTLLRNLDELRKYEAETVALGFEGIMLRTPHSLYKYGRSTTNEFMLMKLKRFSDGEALILGLVEQQKNNNEATINELGRIKRSSHKANKAPKGTTGALAVKDIITGVEFEIGTGMDDQIRSEFWADPPIGQIVKYKFQQSGVKEKPRFPVFLGLRDPRDM